MALTNNNLDKKKNLKLSIQVNLSGLSFCILNFDTNSIVNLKKLTFNKKLNPFEVLIQLKELLAQEKVLEHSFEEVLIIHINELSTLVADALFNKDALADYLKFNAKILKSDFIAYDSIKVLKSKNVYVPYVNINNFIYDQFGEFTYKHYSTILIEKILGLENKLNEAITYIHVGNGHFELIVVENEGLKLYNTFQYNTKEDFIYFILFNFEQLKLDPEKHQVVLLGNIKEHDELYKVTYKYIRHVDFLNSSKLRLNGNNNDSNLEDFIILNSF